MVRDAKLLAEGLHVWLDRVEIMARQGRKQVMFNLIIQSTYGVINRKKDYR
jgi:hypothetical protein